MTSPGVAAPRVLLLSRGNGRELVMRLRRVGFETPDAPVACERWAEGLDRFAPELLLVDGTGEAAASLWASVAAVSEASGRPVVVVVERIDRDNLDRAARAGARGCLPTSVSDEALLAFLDMARRDRPSGNDADTLRRSLDHLHRALEQTITALAVTSEQRDPFTAGHQDRVSRLADAIAEAMGLSHERRTGVRMAGLVHDIGKIHVPSEILAKTEALSSLEMEIVREHSAVGYAILKDVPFPWPIARMVLEHHERLDGSGYPSGLVGADTLVESRILAVADVVEAMTSHRPYRSAYSLDRALDEIRGQRGVRYDAEVVDACLRVCGNGFSFDEKRPRP